MKKFSLKATAFLFAALIAFSSVFFVSSAAIEEATGEKNSIFETIGNVFRASLNSEDNEEIADAPVLTVSSESMTVVKGKTVQMKASVSGVEAQPSFTWSSSDKSVATVDGSGLVKGISTGKSTITASAVVNGEKLSGEFVINVITHANPVKNLLERKQILSYQYSYIDDYYYTNDKDCWQDNFGFGKCYDLVAPYVLMEYDYARVFFTYEGKDWMIQLWKGQYGLLFFGGEIGVYNKEHTGKEDTVFTMYGCPGKEDWLKMEMTLYHDEGGGNYVRQFTREYGDYWWCTGFKDGHLRQQEPADELRMTGRITMKDGEMTRLFTQGLIDCGFEQSESLDTMQLDQFYAEGNDVYIKWQNISEAENTMPIKIGIGVMTFINISAFFLMILSFLAMLGMGAIFLFIIL